MPEPCAKVARGLLLHGRDIEAGVLSRDRFLRRIGVPPNTFRAAGENLGAKTYDPGLRFFDSSRKEWIAFGPGAGLVLGASIGTASLRLALFDANGRMYYARESPKSRGQLSMHPDDFVRHLAESVKAVLEDALSPPKVADPERPDLLVDGTLPLLGVAVAWPTPIDRDKKPVGPALAHRSWRSGRTLTDRVAEAVRLPVDRVYALNDAHAAAISIAYDRTRVQAARRPPQNQAELEIVVRLSATVGAAAVLIEPPTTDSDSDHGQYGPTSGFAQSTLIGGRDGHAGQLAHLTVSEAALAACNGDAVPDLGPLVAAPCSCGDTGSPVLDHLESFVATEALAARLAPGQPIGTTINHLTRTPDDPRHQRVLTDIGAMLADALVPSVAMLNPAGITLTGALAVRTVQLALQRQLAKAIVYGTPPHLSLLPDGENKYVRARGAALVVMRDAVHRRHVQLIGGKKLVAEENVRANVLRLETSPI